MAVVGVTDLDSSIDIRDTDARSAASQFAVQIVTDKAVMANFQAKVIRDSARDRRSFQVGLGVGRKNQVNAAVHRRQLDRRIREPVEMSFHPAVDGLKFDLALQTLRRQSSVDAGGPHLGDDAVNIQRPVDQFDFVEAYRARDGQSVLHPGRIVSIRR